MTEHAIPRPEYPRPQFVRDPWLNLNGVWELAVGEEGDAVPAGKALAKKIGADVTFRGAIIAPHAEVHVFSRAVFEGHIAAKRIVLEPKVTLHCAQ